MTIAEALAWAQTELGPAGRLDAEVLLSHCLSAGRSYLYTWPERTLPPEIEQRYRALVADRATGQPVAHLTQSREFWSLPLRVTADTLIPRPETELLIELALPRLPTHGRGLDLGTGSGAIALALASEKPRAAITATDASAAALAVARDNARRLGLEHVELLQGSWYAPLGARRFDLIVSNPPYIAADEPELTQGDCRFDPRAALIAADNGLADLAAIAHGAPAHLEPGGWLLVEHGYRQGEPVRALFAAAGFADIETAHDLQGHERVTLGRLPQPRET